jgi:hypothetical protein
MSIDKRKSYTNKFVDDVTDTIKKEVVLLFKSPWHYWYTGQKNVAVINWSISLIIPIILFVIAFFTAHAPLIYLLEFIMVIILDSLIWLVIGFLAVLIFTLDSTLPTWLPSVGTDTIHNLITTLIVPLILMGIYGFSQSRIVTRVVAKYTSINKERDY